MTLGPLELVPRWVFALTLAAMTVLAVKNGAQEIAARAELAELKVVMSAQTAAAEKAARRAAEEKLTLVAEHNRKTQESENAFIQTLSAAQDRARVDAATVDRLRNKIASYTSSGGRTDQATTVTRVDLSDRLAAIGGLLGESIGLLVEGRSIIERRDAEVMLLRTQIEIDRFACQSGDKKSAAATSP